VTAVTSRKQKGAPESRRAAVGAGGAGRLPPAKVGNHISRMIRIAITPAAYAAIAATLALGTVAVEPERAQDGVCISGSTLASPPSSRRCAAQARATAT
jgi:hypothetical protein